MDIHVLFEDNHCLAVAKPAPLLTQAPAGVPSLEALVRDFIKERDHKAGNIYLGVPHRLDRPVSGVVLFAKSSKAARRLSEQFADRSVIKHYWAAVDRAVTPANGTWDDWIRKITDEARAETVEPGTPGAQHAVTRYHCLRSLPDGTLLELRPETGRMHQIRVQAAKRGMPVLGDALYGSTRQFGPPADLPRDRTIALHARSLTFLHPIRYEPVTVEAPLPEAWQPFGDMSPAEPAPHA